MDAHVPKRSQGPTVGQYLAVAVVIGAAFGKVVTALVEDLMNPLIAAAVGKPDPEEEPKLLFVLGPALWLLWRSSTPTC